MAANTLWKYIMLCGARTPNTKSQTDVRRGGEMPPTHLLIHSRSHGEIGGDIRSGQEGLGEKGVKRDHRFRNSKERRGLWFCFVATTVKQNALDQHRRQHSPGYQNPRCIIESATKEESQRTRTSP